MFQTFPGGRQYQYVGAFLDIGMHPKIWGLWHSAVLNHYGCSTYSVYFYLKRIKCDKFLFKEMFLFIYLCLQQIVFEMHGSMITVAGTYLNAE